MTIDGIRPPAWRSLAFMVCLSLALHLTFAVWATWQDDEIKIAGGAESAATTVGQAFADTLVAGTDMPVIEPEVQNPDEVVEAEAVETPQAVAAIEPQAVMPTEVSEITPVVSELTAGVVNSATEGRFIEAETAMELPLEVEAAKPAEIKPEELRPEEPKQEELTETKPLEVTKPIELLKQAEIKTIEPQQVSEPSKVEPVETVEPDVQQPVEQQVAEAVPVPNVRPEPPKPAKSQKPKTQKKPAQKANSATGAGGAASRNAQKGGASSARQASQAGNAAVSNYPGQIARKLRRARRYPSAAKRKRLTGEVVVAFTVDRSGRASRIRIARSSGHDILDQAGLETVRRASPFPKIPPEAGRTSWNFTVPLAFQR
ncbi:TonB family protein [Roseibium sp.]|uniref:energy transducer TonB family protein n=1 Tax=Roseibium sp. TaxID=1936156 RepID=UPI003A98202B